MAAIGDAPLPRDGEGEGAATTVVSDLEHSSGLDTETFFSLLLLAGPGEPGSSTDELISKTDLCTQGSKFNIGNVDFEISSIPPFMKKSPQFE